MPAQSSSPTARQASALSSFWSRLPSLLIVSSLGSVRESASALRDEFALALQLGECSVQLRQLLGIIGFQNGVSGQCQIGDNTGVEIVRSTLASSPYDVAGDPVELHHCSFRNRGRISAEPPAARARLSLATLCANTLLM